jgi:hypothetical protein
MARAELALFGVAAIVLSLGGLTAGCATEAAAPDPGPTCADTRLSQGDAYRYDPATAIAVSRGIAHSHPELEGIVDAVADHQQRHPVTERFTTREGGLPADISFTYVMVLVNLVAHPDVANPTTLAILEDTANGPTADSGDSGIRGIYRLVTDDERVLEAGDTGIAELSNLVYSQIDAVEDAGIVDILWTACARESEE